MILRRRWCPAAEEGRGGGKREESAHGQGCGTLGSLAPRLQDVTEKADARRVPRWAREVSAVVGRKGRGGKGRGEHEEVVGKGDGRAICLSCSPSSRGLILKG